MTPIATVQTGHVVALALTRPVGGMSCWVGEVQEVDDRGVRITLVDWLIGSACGYDLFAPWPMIAAALVATEDHDQPGFGDDAAAFQTACNRAALDVGDFDLTADDLRAVALAYYPDGDPRLEPPDEPVHAGRLRGRLRSLADAMDRHGPGR
jgi:hypothetical protein